MLNPYCNPKTFVNQCKDNCFPAKLSHKVSVKSALFTNHFSVNLSLTIYDHCHVILQVRYNFPKLLFLLNFSQQNHFSLRMKLKIFDVFIFYIITGVRKEKKRGGRSFYPLKKYPKAEEELQSPSCSHSEPQEDYSGYSSDIITRLMLTDPLTVPPGEPLAPNEIYAVAEQPKIELLTRLSNAISRELCMIVEWAKILPGFAELSRKDQMALLTAAGMEIIVFRLIYRSIPYNDQINMSSTSILSREDSYSVLNKDLVDLILDVVARLRSINIDDVEFACLMAILLTDPGN